MNLRGIEVINTRPWLCDGMLHWWKWSNPTGEPIRVQIARQWVGLDGGLESDTHAETYVMGGDGKPLGLLIVQQLDNYRHRSFEQERWVSFAPNYVEIPADGGLQLNAVCHQISGGSNAHVFLHIWY